ncbi:putative fatty acyl-CoA reductase CG5065 [Xylocopa sonorina]|uniref:putative fatty acyl-CoA reductase CG5065 n=1 Tax=Xylocopa sonorina TaxID=1818115 RepID=UPI00403A8FE5
MATMNGQINSEYENDDRNLSNNTIEEFYADSVILVTGATGFLGNALLEKLLRSCSRLATIFILIRPKEDQTVEQRYKHLLENSVFEKIKAKNPSLLNKIYPVKGDVSLPNLGITPEDRIMLQQRVNIVFHSAATIRFNEPLKLAVNLNAKGTDRILQFCKTIKNLVSIVYVSTAYSNANRQDVGELIYPTKVKPSVVIDMCDNLDQETLNKMEEQILENHPNTYTFTKNLAEQIIQEKGKDLPIAIVRPSVVGAAEKEPFPGWVSSPYGLTGVFMEIGAGTVRSILCNSTLKPDVVPVDYVIDTLICVAWYTMIDQSKTLKIYNCTDNCTNRLRWNMLRDLVKKHAIESPSKYMIWYPSCSLMSNKFMYSFMTATFHPFTAFIGDFFLRLLGNKPVMVKRVRRSGRILDTLKFFGTHEWNFHKDNMDHLAKVIQTMKDYDNFNVSIEHLNWDRYIHHYMIGIKKYILKENHENLPVARSRLFVLYLVHRLTQISSIFILLTMILRFGH